MFERFGNDVYCLKIHRQCMLSLNAKLNDLHAAICIEQGHLSEPAQPLNQKPDIAHHSISSWVGRDPEERLIQCRIHLAASSLLSLRSIEPHLFSRLFGSMRCLFSWWWLIRTRCKQGERAVGDVNRDASWWSK